MICPRRGAAKEDLKNLFFDYVVSANIQANIPSIQGPCTDNILEWRSWLKHHMKHSYGHPGVIMCFTNAVIDTNIISISKFHSKRDIRIYYFPVVLILLYQKHEICVQPFPGPGGLKLYIDGSSQETQERASFGGVFREEKEHYIIGYYGKLEDCTNLEAELRAF